LTILPRPFRSAGRKPWITATWLLEREKLERRGDRDPGVVHKPRERGVAQVVTVEAKLLQMVGGRLADAG